MLTSARYFAINEISKARARLDAVEALLEKLSSSLPQTASFQQRLAQQEVLVAAAIAKQAAEADAKQQEERAQMEMERLARVSEHVFLLVVSLNSLFAALVNVFPKSFAFVTPHSNSAPCATGVCQRPRRNKTGLCWR